MSISELIDAINNYYEIRNDILNGELYPILVDEVYQSFGIHVDYGVHPDWPKYAINLYKIALMINEFAYYPILVINFMKY